MPWSENELALGRRAYETYREHRAETTQQFQGKLIAPWEELRSVEVDSWVSHAKRMGGLDDEQERRNQESRARIRADAERKALARIAGTVGVEAIRDRSEERRVGKECRWRWWGSD